jgi:GNAT superfamily N-acetyltransferase
MSQYEFEPIFHRANIMEYVELFQKCYGTNKKLSEDYLSWLYVQNPHGHAVGFDAFINGRLAAHYVTIPRVYKGPDGIKNGLLSVNTATDPSYQGRGLFTKLASLTYEYASSQGLDFVIGVANSQSIYGFSKKLGFANLGQVRLSLWDSPLPYDDSAFGLSVDANWLRWRLANPSASYFFTSKKNNNVLINVKQGKFIFSIGCHSRELINELSSSYPWHINRGIVPLSPVFPSQNYWPLVPKKLMPSPWHLIYRSLSPNHKEPTNIRVDGLSMDTF